MLQWMRNLHKWADLVEFVGRRRDVELKQQLRQHVEELLTAGSCRNKKTSQSHSSFKH